MDMKAHDTETTGLWWQHGTQAFLVGVYSTGGDYQQWEWEIDPRTRRRYPTHGTEKACEEIRESLLSGVSVFQNANFDLKAYAELGVIDWQEPCDKKFWDGIVELGHLTHLHSSQDCREGNSSLKVLTPKYLNRNYQSQDDLVSLVNQCRAFVRSRKPSWQINSDHCNLISVQPCKDKHNLADYWLPSAVVQEFSDVELLEYFGMDKQQMVRVVGDYMYDDVKNTHDLAQFFLQQIPGDEMDQLAMNRDIAHVIWKMEIRGIAISLTDISTAMQTCQNLMDDYHQQTLEITGKEHSAWTPALLRNQLFEEWDMEPIAYTPKAGDPQVNSDCLGKLAEKASPEQSEFINLLLAWKKLDKKRQFLESYKGYTIPCRLLPANYPEKGAQGKRAYPGYKATGTTTTRFSSYNPNQQQIEKPEEERDEDDLLYNAPSIRSLIKPRPGYGLYALDYSQLQLRIFAYLTEEEDLIQSFKDGWDFHDYMAHRIFDKDDINKHERRIGKNTNFGFIFGASVETIEQTAGMDGLYDELMEMFPNAHEFIQSTKEQIQATGLVRTMGGYPMSLPLTEDKYRPGTLSYQAHKGVNYRVQGTEGEIVKRAMVLCDQHLEFECPDGAILMQVHDEIVFEIPLTADPSAIYGLKDCMEEAARSFGVEAPVDIEFSDKNWALVKEWDGGVK